MQLKLLETMDEARGLVDLVYESHGLTFWREAMYDAASWLASNREGHVTSVLAVDDRRVVGHAALVRPFFEVTRDGQPLTDPTIREAGLDLVAPTHRGLGLRSRLFSALGPIAAREQLSGVYETCAGHQLGRQRTAVARGGRPVAIGLGAIPRWIPARGDERHEDQPISTVTYFSAVNGDTVRTVFAPREAPWLAEVMRRTGVARRVADDWPAGLTWGSTRMVTDHCAQRQLGRVFVHEPGLDLVERVDKAVTWLLCGNMRHVSVYMPADCPQVAAAFPELLSRGLVPAGVLPMLFDGRRDALALQAVAQADLDLDRVHVAGPDAERLRGHVVAAWQEAPRLVVGELERRAA